MQIEESDNDQMFDLDGNDDENDNRSVRYGQRTKWLLRVAIFAFNDIEISE